MNLSGYEPLKNIRKRIHFWYVVVVLFILVDEYIKEGYFFSPADVFKPLTHENLILLATILYVVANVVMWLKREGV